MGGWEIGFESPPAPDQPDPDVSEAVSSTVRTLAIVGGVALGVMVVLFILWLVYNNNLLTRTNTVVVRRALPRNVLSDKTLNAPAA